MNHQVLRWVFALSVGFVAAWFAFQWATTPMQRDERELEESVVLAARAELREQLLPVVGTTSLDIVDPLAPNRAAGKVYVFRADDGWEVSGYFRRDAEDRWHPYLIRLNSAEDLTYLKIRDPALVDKFLEHEAIEVLP